MNGLDVNPPESFDDNNNGVTVPKPTTAISESEIDNLDLKENEVGSIFEHQQTNQERSPSCQLHNGSAVSMADNNTTTCVPSQRKLPIPNTAANANSNLKGILIKPKRILPAQPDSSKVKRTVQENGSQYKTTERADDNPHAGLNQTSESVNDSDDSSRKLNIPKLDIDVDRLKSYFQTHKNDVGRRYTDFNGKDIQSGIIEGENSTSVRPQSECGNAPHLCLTRENTLYNFSPDGLSKVREWCSPSEMNKMATKMATDSSVKKCLERGIRSPSPKSNTTWDRSSSGYSSDERPDPKSPPLIHSACVSSKAETDIVDDDGVSMVTDKSICNHTQTNETCHKDSNNVKITCKNNDEHCVYDDLARSKEEGNSNLNVSNQTTDAGETINQSVNLQLESTAMIKQNTRRPAWSPLSNMSSASGRIQYRKSGSESMISLRHPSRQGQVDSNFDGLEVCGKSYPQTPSAFKSDLEVAKLDSVSRPETSSPSVFAPIERQVPNLELGNEVPKNASNGQESAVKLRNFRQQFAVCGSPRDIKNLTLNLNAKLNLPKDESDIRKSLHNLSSPRRQSPGGKVAPIRARHMYHMPSSGSNQAMAAFDTSSSQPTNTAFTSLQKPMNFENGKAGVKSFGKKMWRAPSGQPENAQMRPFSPFGGTLPPSKIKEQEKKRHSPDPPPL